MCTDSKIIILLFILIINLIKTKLVYDFFPKWSKDNITPHGMIGSVNKTDNSNTD